MPRRTGRNHSLPITRRAGDSEISRVFEKQQRYALKLRTSTVAQRIAALEKLKAAVNRYADQICAAGFADFRKPEPLGRLSRPQDHRAPGGVGRRRILSRLEGLLDSHG